MKQFLMRVALLVTVLVPVALSSPLAAQTAGKVGFVNMRRVLAETPGYAEAESTFVREMATYRGQFQTLQSQLDTAAASFEQQSAMLSPSARQARRNELQAKQDSIESQGASLQQRAATRERELLDPIQAKAIAVIERLRERGGYTMIFDVSSQASTIVTADKALDLTEAAVAAVKAPGS